MLKVIIHFFHTHSFYRYVAEAELQFTADGKLSSGPDAKFTGLPTSPLLTQNLQVCVIHFLFPIKF